jgi:hypothetical protein
MLCQLYPEKIGPSLLLYIKPVVLQKLSSRRSVSGSSFMIFRINALSSFEISLYVICPNDFFFSAGIRCSSENLLPWKGKRIKAYYLFDNHPQQFCWKTI